MSTPLSIPQLEVLREALTDDAIVVRVETARDLLATIDHLRSRVTLPEAYQKVNQTDPQMAHRFETAE